MNLKKILLNAFLFIAATITVVNGNDFRVPMDREGKRADTIKDSYVRVASVRYTTTATMLVRGATIQIYGVLTSTLPLGSIYAGVELRSTNTANTSSELLVPPLRISTEIRNTMYVFDPPILCPEGLSVNLTSAGTVASIFYNFSSTRTRADFFIPYDMDNIKASSDFYGVKVASNVAAGSAADVIGTESLDNTVGEKVIATTRGLWYGVMGGTVTNKDSYIVVEDSASVLGNPVDFLPPFFYKTYNLDGQSDGAKNQIVKFPWPLLFENGLNVANNSDNDRIRMFTRPARSLR